jgi:putative MATE family efflux protein
MLGRLWTLAWPIVGLNLLSVLALAVDTAMCGRLDDADSALAALGYATQLVFLLMVAMMGLTVGAVALVSRAHGAGEVRRVNHVLLQSTQLTVLVGLTVGILGNAFAPAMMEALGASAVVRDLGVSYLRPMLAGATFFYLNMLYAAVMRGVGNTRVPFVVALASNAVNVFLNYGLILGNMGFPALGVQGAAIGSVCSYAFGAAILIVLLRREVIPRLRLSLRPEPLDLGLAKELYRVGVPAALDMLLLQGSFLSIVGMLARIDEAGVAAHGVGLRVQALAFVPGLAVSQATAAMVGHALGAGDVDEARQVVRSSVLLCTAIMTGLAIGFVLGAHPVMRVFDVEPGTRLEELSVLWMQILGFGMPIVGVNIAYVGMLRGAGATNTSLYLTVVAVLVQIPTSWALGFPGELGALGVWLGFPLSFVLKAGLGWLVYHRGRWAKIGLHA